MTLSRLSLYAIGFTLAAMVFILVNGAPFSLIFMNLLWADLPLAALMFVVLLIGHLYGRQCSEDVNWVEKLLLELDRHRLTIAFILWVALSAGTIWVYQDHPLSMDEYAAVFQAKIFAAGALHGEYPPELLNNLIPSSFQNQFIMVNHETGAVLSAYWPGFSLLLLPFVWLGIPWACNPTIVAVTFLLIGRLTRDLTSSQLAAGWALLFALASPAFVANGITYYSMPAHLLFNLGFAWLLLTPSPLRLFLSGLVGSFALTLHNPYPHAVFALPWIIWLATRHGQILRNLFFLILGYLPLSLLLGMGWLLWRQDVLNEGATVAIMASASGSTPVPFAERLMGFASKFLSMLHWPNEPIIYARLGGLAKLWLWASPLLLLLAWWGGRRAKVSGVRLMGASALLTFFAYFLIKFDQGHGWGYRYFHSAWGVLPILGALGVSKLSAIEGKKVFAPVALLALFSLFAANALQFVQMGNFMADHLAQFPPRAKAEMRIVLHNGRGYYAKDLIQNDPWLRGDEIVFLARTPADRGKISERYPSMKEASQNDYGITLIEASSKKN